TRALQETPVTGLPKLSGVAQLRFHQIVLVLTFKAATTRCERRVAYAVVERGNAIVWRESGDDIRRTAWCWRNGDATISAKDRRVRSRRPCQNARQTPARDDRFSAV